MSGVLSAVLDSNVLISLLVFEDPRFPAIAAAWREQRLRVITDKPCAAEFQRVLGYPRLQLGAERQAAIFSEYTRRTLDAGESVGDRASAGARLPLCADREDQKFLELAARSAADCLVTGDRELLKLARRVRFAILTAGELERRLAL